MQAIGFHGRGGQGARAACRMLAAAFVRAGRHVQVFAADGGERPGAPVRALLRVDAAPIRRRCDTARADYVLVFDPTLLPDIPPASVAPDGLVLVNCPTAPCARVPLAARVFAIDATAIAERAGLGPIVSTALLGAFAGATGLLPLAEVCAAVEAGSPARRAEHVAACRAAGLAAAELAGALAGGAS